MFLKRFATIAAVIAVATAPAWGQRGPDEPGHPGGPGHVPPAVRVVHRCFMELNRVVMISARATAHTTAHCVHDIDVAQAAGDNEAAAAAAAECTADVNLIAERATTRIAAIVERCVARLTELEASEEAITHVQEAAAARTARVEENRARAAQRIADALADDGG